MTRIRLLEATARDAYSLEPRLCAADLLERRLACGETLVTLELARRLSVMCYALHINGTPEALCGLAAGPTQNTGEIWCLSSAKMHRYPKQYMRYGRWLIEEGLANFELLENYVYEHNTKSIAWLKRLGAKFEEPRPYGVGGAKFRRFTICANP